MNYLNALALVVSGAAMAITAITLSHPTSFSWIHPAIAVGGVLVGAIGGYAAAQRRTAAAVA